VEMSAAAASLSLASTTAAGSLRVLASSPMERSRLSPSDLGRGDPSQQPSVIVHTASSSLPLLSQSSGKWVAPVFLTPPIRGMVIPCQPFYFRYKCLLIAILLSVQTSCSLICSDK
jgi:hypothetical protein